MICFRSTALSAAGNVASGFDHPGRWLCATFDSGQGYEGQRGAGSTDPFLRINKRHSGLQLWGLNLSSSRPSNPHRFSLLAETAGPEFSASIPNVVCLVSGVAAVHDKLEAGDEGSLVTREKDCAPSDLLRLGAAFEESRIDQWL